jgi:D-tyrosyl-tRNA(Tyr) deacylase
VVQRVSEASVQVNGTVVGSIGPGMLVLLGVEQGDQSQDADYLSAKVAGLRIFEDEFGKMNLSVRQVQGSVLAVSQFTLYGDTRKGMRPSFDRAARPEVAKPLFERFVEKLRSEGLPVETGIFQASMKVTLANEGPVTLICESK